MKESLLTGIDPNDESVDWNTWYRWDQVSKLCFGVGPSKELIVPKKENKIKFVSNFVEVAHSFGLKVSFLTGLYEFHIFISGSSFYISK